MRNQVRSNHVTYISDEVAGRPRRIYCMSKRVLQVVKLNSSPSRHSDGTDIVTRRSATLFEAHGGDLASELAQCHKTRSFYNGVRREIPPQSNNISMEYFGSFYENILKTNTSSAQNKYAQYIVGGPVEKCTYTISLYKDATISMFKSFSRNPSP
jgi:hypothetical protein